MPMPFAKRSRARRPSLRPGLEGLEIRSLLSLAPPSALLVQLAPGSTLDLGPIAAASGASASATGLPDLYRVAGDAAALNRVTGGLAVAHGVRYAEPERTLRVDATPTDPSYANGSLWGLNGAKGIGAPAAWDVTTGSASVIVADIDTGIDYRHNDLYKNVWLNQGEIPASRRANLADFDGDGLITFYDLNDSRNQGPGKANDVNGDGRIDARDILAPMGVTATANGPVDNGTGGWADGISNDGDSYVDDLIGWNFVNNTNDPLDDHGHGTHTAGTIGASANDGGVVGVAWKAQIMGLKFLDAGGNGSDLGAAQAVAYAAAHGARVSNNSYGGGGGGSALGSAISDAAARGHVFVAAAGNEGRNTDTSANYPSGYNLGNIVSVAAIDRNGALASFSNYGAATVDLGAPGVSILSTTTNNTYSSFSGTSMATPHVAGTVALLLSANRDWTYRQVIDRILSTVTASSAMAGKSVTGGVLNAAAALAPPAAATNSASFSGSDGSTGGTWSPRYGSQGYSLVGGASLPSYATAGLSGQNAYTWASGTTDPRALTRPGGSTRDASCWYAPGSFTIDLALTDGAAHAVSLYAVDWDDRGRSQRVDVVDAATGAVLDTRTMSGFRAGSYLTWMVRGNVQLRVTRLAGPNAVVSGLFLDATPPAAATNSASFSGSDGSTGGTWSPRYGSQGYSLVGGASLPSYATAGLSGQNAYTWASGTTDPRALTRPGGSTRDASCWYAPGSFTIDLALTDGAAHAVSLYAVDWDDRGRSQRVDVVDAATGAVLDTRTMSGFRAGSYLTWMVRGNVQLRVTRLAGPNAVVSGLFLDAPSA